MASPPPPYANVTGISRAVMKDSPQETFANYDGNARAGELVVNLDVNPPTLYIGNSQGNLNQVTGGGGGGGNTGNVTFNNINIIGTGNLHLQPDTVNTGSYLDIFLSSGPDLHLVASAAANLILGKDAGPNVMTSWDGNVYVQSWNTGSNTQGGVWNFGEDGNLILAGGNSVIFSTANSSLDPLIPNVSTMTLTPDANYSQQSLVLDPTAPGHIHLRAPAANIDEPYANLFLGGEDSSFEVGYFTGGGAPEVYIHSGGNTWTFSTDGNLFAPGNVRTQANVVVGSEANGYVISPEDSLIMKAYANVQIITNNNSPKTWSFDTTGNLTLPGNIVGASANVQIDADGYTWTFNNLGVVSNPIVTYSALPSANTAGYRAFISDANLVAAGNFGNAVSGGGSNTVPVYSDGSNWRIG